MLDNTLRQGTWGYFKHKNLKLLGFEAFLFSKLTWENHDILVKTDSNKFEATDMDAARQRMLIAAHTPYPLRGGLKMMPKHTPAKRTCVHKNLAK